MTGPSSRRWRFSTRVEHKGETAILFVEGRVGYAVVRDFLAAARECLELPGLRLLILDLAGLDYLNGGGLRGVIELGAEAKARRARVVVRGATDAVRVTLGLADFRRRAHGPQRSVNGPVYGPQRHGEHGERTEREQGNRK